MNSLAYPPTSLQFFLISQIEFGTSVYLINQPLSSFSLQWRRFNFFELLKETDNGTLDRSFKVNDSLKYPQRIQMVIKIYLCDHNLFRFKDVTINCSSSGRGYLILGDNLGLVHLFDRQYQRESFKAYNVNTSHVLQLKQSSFLGTVGVSYLILYGDLDKSC